jgi:hypothetical protein
LHRAGGTLPRADNGGSGSPRRNVEDGIRAEAIGECGEATAAAVPVPVLLLGVGAVPGRLRVVWARSGPRRRRISPRVREILVREVAALPGGVVVEVGAGTGLWSDRLTNGARI